MKRVPQLAVLLFSLCCGALAQNPPTLVSPANGAQDQFLTLTLSWATEDSAFIAQISSKSTFVDTVYCTNQVQRLKTNYFAVPSGLLDSNKTYYWHVKASSNQGGSSAWSNGWSFTTMRAGQPAIPNLAGPPNNAGNQIAPITLSWASAFNLQFIIEVSTNSAFQTLSSGYDTTAYSSVDSLHLTSSFLSYGTKYYWRVQANAGGMLSSWSSVWNFSMLSTPAVPVLSAPLNGAIDQSCPATKLIWGSVTTAVSYTAQISTASTFASTVANQNVTGTALSPNVFVINTMYYWRAEANNNAGISAWSGIWSFKTFTVHPVPTLVYPSNGATNIAIPLTLSLSWSSSNNTAYNLQISTTSSFSVTVYQTNSFLPGVTPANLSNSTKYYWRANTVNTAGTSAWSDVWSFTTLAATPVVAEISPHADMFCDLRNGTLEYSVPAQCVVSVSLFDMRGKLVFISLVPTATGTHRLPLHKLVHAGCYTARFKANRFEKRFITVF